MTSLASIASSYKYKVSRDLFSYLKDIEYAHIKGEALSILAYGTVGKRNSSDIDILIPRKNITITEKFLNESGFKHQCISRADRIMLLSSSHQSLPWNKKINSVLSVTVDLNHDLFWGEYTGRRIDISEFISDTIEMEIYGCKVKSLSPLKAMVQLILHHYKEMNSIYHLAGHNSINYNMFKDVYYLWKHNQKSISLETLYAISLKYEIVPYVFYVLYFTNCIFQDVMLQQYVYNFQTAEGELLLDYYGLAEKERKPWKVDFQTRLQTDNIYELIRNDLTKEDFEKLERNRQIFG